MEVSLFLFFNIINIRKERRTVWKQERIVGQRGNRGALAGISE